MRRPITILLMFIFSLTACGPSAPPAIRPALISERPISMRVAELLGQMTLDEKIGQMTQVEKDSIQPGDIHTYFIGSILSGGGGSPPKNTIEAWTEMIDALQEEAVTTRLGSPILYGLDAIHGHGNLEFGKAFLDSFRKTVKRFAFTILFVSRNISILLVV